MIAYIMKVVLLLLLSILSTTTTTAVAAAAADGTLLLRRELQLDEEDAEREVSSECPIEMLDPVNTECNIESQDGKVCGYEHIWVGGCSDELELECKPNLICTCNLFYDEYWACAADSMSYTCPDGTVPVDSELRGTLCTPPTEEEEDGFIDSAGGGGSLVASTVTASEQSDFDSSADAATETPLLTTTTDLTTTVTTTTTTTDDSSTTTSAEGDSTTAASEGTSTTNTTTTGTTTTVVVPIEFYGINYNTRKGPDWAPDNERCKTRDEIVRDLIQLSKVTSSIRLLSLVDCNQGLLVWSVLNNELLSQNLKMWLGLWVDNDPTNFVNELNALELILMDTTAYDFSHLLGISVGSEAIYRGDVTIDEAIINLELTQSLLIDYNINNVPTTIVEIAPIYSNSEQLRLAVDTIMTNTFPFWEAIPIDNAVDNLDENLSYLLSLPELQDKTFILGEHGWPSAGYIDGVGVASTQNQQQYMADSYCYLKGKGWPYYIFTGIDNDWRQLQDPNNTIEGNWGFLEADLSLKSHFIDFTFDCGNDDGIIYSFSAIDWSVPELAVTEVDTENAVCGLWLGCEALSGNCCPTSNGEYLGCCRTENFIIDSTTTTADGDGSSSGDLSSSSNTDTDTETIVTVPDDVDVNTVSASDVDTTSTDVLTMATTLTPTIFLNTASTDVPTMATTLISSDATTSVTTVTEEKENLGDQTNYPTIIINTPVTTITDAPITAAISKDFSTFSPTDPTSTSGGGGATTEETTNSSSSSGGSSPWNENEINGSASISSAHSTVVAVAALTSWTIVLALVFVVAML